MKIRLLLIPLLALLLSLSVNAQKVVLKTNLLYDAALSPNLGIEIGLAPHWTFDLSGNLNLWTVGDGHKWRHWLVQPEGRYWFCQKFAGHFLGFHALGGQYNIGKIDLPFKFLGSDFKSLKDTRVQGWYAGAGIAYGYDWVLNRRWTIEAELGVGWIYTRYDRFPCAVCGTKIESNRPHNYFGPTKAAINIVYAF